MASLFKRAGSPFWFAAFDITQPDGTVRRFKKTTKKTKRAEAMGEAIRLEELERKKHAASGDAAAKSYHLLTEAAEAAAKGELSEARAREILAKITEASTGTPLRFYTVRTWAADWLAAKSAGAKAATVTRYTAHIGVFLDWLADRADARLEAITKTDVRKFRDEIRKGWGGTGQPRTGKTTNHYAADVASMFRSAVREGLLLASPASAIEKLPEDDSTQREVFSLAEIALLIDAAGKGEWQSAMFSDRAFATDLGLARSRDWQGLILVGFYVGPRLLDGARLTGSHVDEKRGVIEFMPRKTERKKKRLQVPLHPRLAAFLASHDVPKGEDQPLFPSLATTNVGGRTGLSSQFVAIMAAAGIDRGEARATVKDKKGKSIRRAVFTRSYHSLRHSLTSALANLDVPEEIRRRITGHDSKESHQIYTHTERATLARALEKLPTV